MASINTLLGRNSGPFKFIEADIVIKARDLEKAHSVSQKIEREIRQQVSHVDHILIHYAPKKKKTITYAIPLKQDKQGISEHFGDAPYFYLAKVKNKDGVIISEMYYQNPFSRDEKGKGIKISQWLVEKGIDTIYSPKGFEGKGPGYVFSDAGVDTIVAKDQSLDEIKRSFLGM